MLERYYNFFDPSKRYAELLFRAGDGLQSRELNELQTTINNRLKGVADALLKDGNIVAGGEIVIDADAGRALLAAARIYIKGAVHDVPAAEFAIPTTGEVTLGVRLKETVITELEDPSLREPAVGVRNYQEPGAGRLKVEALWGWAGNGGADVNAGLPFYPVASVVDGVLQNRERPPAFDGVKQMLARYDYDANGHYLVSGLGVRFLGRRSEDGKLTFGLAAGVCNVAGFKVEKPYDDRLALDFDPDIQRVLAEPTVFAPDANGRMRINVNYAPLAQVVRVQGTQRKTVNVTHGVFSGAADTLPDATVVQVLSVKQGATTYQVGQDYTVAGNVINWAPAGSEPAPGSSYSVTYDYIAQVTPTGVDEDGFTVDGFVAGTLVQVDYDWMLPRIDALVIDRDGLVQRIKGVAVERNPNPPAMPADLLRLCDLHLTWRAAQPARVIDSAVRAVPTYELQAMRDDIARLYGMMARDRLTQDITLREPAAKAGVFADPFRDDDLRDAGIAQSAVIVGGALRAPIAVTVLGPYLAQPQMLPFGLTTALEQTTRTGAMKVNPYQAVLPAPVTVTLNPARDFWAEFQTSQAAAITETIVLGEGDSARRTVSRTTEVVSRIETAIPTLRPIAVAVRAAGFGPNEAVSAMRFDGIALSVPTGLKANAQGVVETSFTIPTGIAAGVKRFEIDGAFVSRGEATFEGRGTLVSQTTRERVTTTITRWGERVTTNITRWPMDPLAQTFTLPDSRQVAAVELWFTVSGARPVTVQIRETSVGMPTRTVLAEGRIESSAIQTTGATRIAFDMPAWLQAGVEYALVVLTDDADTSVAIAELGKWDAANGRWVTSQPYQVGVLLSSSNASTWTAHQDKDLAFRLLGVARSASARSVTVAQDVVVSAATDLLVLGAVELPKSGCGARVRLTLDDGRALSTVLGGTVSLQAPYSGKVQVAVDLTGLPDATPILAPGVQLVVGTLADTADYVSRAIPAKASFTARVIAEVFAPGTASVTAKAEAGSAGSYATLPAVAAEPVGDGWVEIEWRASSLQGVGADKLTRVRLEISNSAAHRALVRNLRAVIV